MKVLNRSIFRILMSRFAYVMASVLILTFVCAQKISERIDELAQQLTDGQSAPGELALSTEIFANDGQKMGEFAEEQRYYVALDMIPLHVQQAFIAAEDKDFHRHHGVSFSGIFRAALVNIRNWSKVQGASTITQQLARAYFLHPSKTWKRKIDELLLALAIEKKWTKKQILEAYLNKIFFGNHAYGIEAAARHYFGKSVNDLTIQEGAILAGIVAAPTRFAPHRYPGKTLQRLRYVIGQMREEGYLTDTDAQQIKSSRIILAGHPLEKIKISYGLEEIATKLEKSLSIQDLNRSGYRIDTTLDARLQFKLSQYFEQIISEHFNSDGFNSELQAAALIVDTSTFEIRAIQGGLKFEQSQFNRATSTRRNLGTIFVPFYYALAFDRGVRLDAPLYNPTFSRLEKNQKFYHSKEPTILDGLNDFLPEESTRLLATVGIGTAQEFASEMGFEVNARDFSLATGDHVRGNLALTTATLAGLCSGARFGNPILVKRVTSKNGQTVLSETTLSQNSRYVSPAAGFITATALRQSLGKMLITNKIVDSRFDLFGGYAGTDQRLHDAWMIGFTDHLAIGLWIGSEHGKLRLAPDQNSLRNKILRSWTKLVQSIDIKAQQDFLGEPPEDIAFVPKNLPHADNHPSFIPVKTVQSRF